MESQGPLEAESWKETNEMKLGGDSFIQKLRIEHLLPARHDLSAQVSKGTKRVPSWDSRSPAGRLTSKVSKVPAVCVRGGAKLKEGKQRKR